MFLFIMFWKVAGFSQPSPIEQILDKEEFTLEELLDEDDIIQECKSLNGRLIVFLRERSTVEQLIKYLVEPPQDSDDPKRCYKYPFTACEVFCCEVEAVFDALLEDSDLMRLLFSLLDNTPPLNCKVAGYFGRVVGHLLLRKTNELMQYLQDNSSLLEKLIKHVDTTSISDIIKRLVGADEQTSMLFIPTYAEWLARTPLIELLLDRLATGFSSEVQTNAADILSAIAHTQPTPLAAKLTQEDCIKSLFQRALQPGGQVLVPALDVCIALLEPRRNAQEPSDSGSSQDASTKAKAQAVCAIVQYLPKLIDFLSTEDPDSTQETPYGLLHPPLGRPRLKIVELIAVLMRTGDSNAEQAVIQTESISLCMRLFQKYPFNNLLHHSVRDLIRAALRKPSEKLVRHLLEDYKLVDWLISLPEQVTPTPRPGTEATAQTKAALRAGYLGHVTQLATELDSIAGTSGVNAEIYPQKSVIVSHLNSHKGWEAYLQETLQPRLELENVSKWACGRPAATELAGLDSDGDEYQNDMDLEQLQGMQPQLYHRYSVVDEHDEDDDEGNDTLHEYKASVFGTIMITEAISGMDLNDASALDENISEEIDKDQDQDEQRAGGLIHGERAIGEQGMDDDDVLLATSDEDELLADEAVVMTDANEADKELQVSDDMVIVEEEIPEAVDDEVAAKAPGGSTSEKEYNQPHYWSKSYPLDVAEDG